MKKIVTAVVVFLSIYAAGAWAFESGLSGYTVKVSSRETQYQLMSFFILPNEKVSFEVVQGNKSLPFIIEGKRLAKTQVKKNFTWVAPKEPGYYRLRIAPDMHKSTELIMFVMRPLSDVKQGKLDAFNIGTYPAKKLKALDVYAPPQGFVMVTKEMESMYISPHYKLGQFLCKQRDNYPKYLTLHTQLLNKLELLTQAVNDEGIATNGFVVMSGFRTPHYNKILNNAVYSYHQWGGAADIFIDENPKNGVMDDLNKDGKTDQQDAQYLAEIVEKLDHSLGDAYDGGMGLYEATPHHGPFVHIDVRGYKARW